MTFGLRSLMTSASFAHWSIFAGSHTLLYHSPIWRKFTEKRSKPAAPRSWKTRIWSRLA